MVYSRMTFGLQYDCSYTSSDIPSSAVDVLDFYCSAAKDQVVATVTESVSQSYATAYEGSGSGSDEPQETGTGGDGEHDGGNQEGESGSGGGISKGATIAAAVVGGVAGLLIIAAIFWFVRRRSHKKTTVAATATTEASEQYEKPELSGSAPPNIGSEWDSAQSPSPGYPGPDSQNPQSTPGISELQGTVSSGYSMPPWQSPQELEHPPQELAQSEQSPVTYPRTDARTT